VENKVKQRRNGKLLGGITGKGFVPGQSGNPNGRPRTKGLLNSLKVKITEVGADGRTVEELLVAALIEEAFEGRNRMAALAYIFDRLEGRPRQEVDVRSLSEDISSRSDEELRFYLKHDHWPDADALLTESGDSNGTK